MDGKDENEEEERRKEEERGGLFSTVVKRLHYNEGTESRREGMGRLESGAG